MTRGRPLLGITAAVLALAAAPGVAVAELYRCARPDGSTTFTDNPSACPHSQPHELQGVVQKVRSPVPSRRPAAASPPSSSGGEALRQRAEQSEEARWRQRKQRSEEELRQVEERRQRLEEYVTHCNRGGEIFAREERSGLKHGVSCDSVRADYAALESRRASLRDYLERGIYEECRRAGCLPGWLR